MEDTSSRAIAIVGAGAVLPDAPNVATFWQNIKSARYSVSEVPPERWNPAFYYDADPKAPEKTYSKIGGWVREFVWEPMKWKMPIPPRVVDAMDDSQKWALACTREALEDYGYPERPINTDRTAVILGNALGGEKHYRTVFRVNFPEFAHELEQSATFAGLPESVRRTITKEFHERMNKNLPDVTEDTMPGELANCIAGRIANIYNFHGPNFVTDAACASSMAGMYAAMKGLADHDFDVAIAGGIDRNMGASTFVKFCKIGALSATGTRPYADGADGFVMGEGAAVFVMKRLADAEREGDKIYAVLRGMAGSSDGKGKGITAPNPIGQKICIERAWHQAGLSPATVTLVEGHGTSTKVGDVVEAQGMADVLATFNLPKRTVALGSVKSNFGHLKGAAGAAGMLKAILSLRDKVLPPSLHFERPNPNIDFSHSPLYVNSTLKPWDVPEGVVRRAGLSAFGFGGTNFHAVIEEYVPHMLGENGKHSVAVGATPRASASVNAPSGRMNAVNAEKSPANVNANAVNAGNAGSSAANASASAPESSKKGSSVNNDVVKSVPPGDKPLKAPLRGALVIGAATEGELIERLRVVLKAAEAGNAPAPVAPAEADLRATERLAIDYANAAELAEKAGKALKALKAKVPAIWKALRPQGIFRGHGPAPKVAFLYTGQGSQYVNMMQKLRAEEPVVAETFAEADRILTPLLGKPLSEFIFIDGADPVAVAKAEDDLRQTAITQPAVIATDLAITRLLAAYGVVPDMAMGHSVGEYGALVASGALPFDDAMEAVSARGREMTTLSLGDNGGMAAVFAPLEEVERILKTIDGYVVLANINSKTQAVIGGETKPLNLAIEAFVKAGYNAMPLPVSHAFHTVIVAQASAPLKKMLIRLRLQAPRVPIIANLDGKFYPSGPDTREKMIEMLAQQVASPVQFVKGLETLYEAGARVFIEAGPKKALHGFAEDVLGGRGDVVALFTNHPKLEDNVAFNQALCGLYAAGLGHGRGGDPETVVPKTTEKVQFASVAAPVQVAPAQVKAAVAAAGVAAPAIVNVQAAVVAAPVPVAVVPVKAVPIAPVVAAPVVGAVVPAAISAVVPAAVPMATPVVPTANVAALVAQPPSAVKVATALAPVGAAAVSAVVATPAAIVKPAGIAAPVPEPTAPNATEGKPETGDRFNELGHIFAEVIERGWKVYRGDENSNEPVAITGAALGLPGSGRIFEDDNVARILRGDCFINAIPKDLRQTMLDKHITRLVKNDKGGARFESIDSLEDVIKLAGRGGDFDPEKEFGISAERLAALDRVTSLAIGAGIDALRDAGIPLIMHYKTTSIGTLLPDRWGLPQALRDSTGVIFGSAFPGYDAYADEMERFYSDHSRRAQLAVLEDLRKHSSDAAVAKDLDQRIAELHAKIEKDPYTFDRRFLFKALAMGHSQFAEFIGARGPNTQINSACASTTQAITLAEDWIRAGRCQRVIVIAADDVTSKNLIGWIGAGFLASGAAATDELVEEAATPFDRRRHGLIMGMGAAALVVESAAAARERGIRPICEVLSSATANSAFHGSRLDVNHICQVMEGLVSQAESKRGISRRDIAPKMVFMSHETYTPARGGSAAAEICALRQVFGDLADKIVIANTKGFTGHAMACGIEDVVVVKALETGCVPPVANFKEVDPELGELNLSKGGLYPVEYALRLGAGFGSQISMTLLRWVKTKDGVRPGTNELGYATRIIDPKIWKTWLGAITGAPEAELEVVHRTLRVRDQRAAARIAELAKTASQVAPGAPPPAAQAPAIAKPVVPAAVAVKPVVSALPSAAAAMQPPPIAKAAVQVAAAAASAVQAPVAKPVAQVTAPLTPVIQAAPVAKPVMPLQAAPTPVPAKPIEQAALPMRPAMPTKPIAPTTTPAIPAMTKTEPALSGAVVARAVTQNLKVTTPVVLPTPKTSSPIAETTMSALVKECILALAVEKTGYPEDMLDLDLDLEADLGVDTVKQAEMFAAIREIYSIPRDENIKLRDFPTLAKVIQFVYDKRPDLLATAPVAQVAVVEEQKVAPVAAGGGVKERILALAVEKTGYPEDMLDLDLDLEADLGVDTVKQAEMFAAIREIYSIPRDENIKLRDFPTLAKVIQFVYSKRPDLLGNAPVVQAAVVEEQKVVEASAPVVAVAAGGGVKERILALAVEKTGYPEDMLDLDLDLEADLGVDTVKQAEMFAAIREIYSIPRDENIKLRDFPTLAKVIQFVYSKRPDLLGNAPVVQAVVKEQKAVEAVAPVAVAAAGGEVKERILALAVEKTGYPEDMLDLDLDLEADLGVDTVKQAEMFAAIREIYSIPRDENIKLRDFPTLAKVIQFVYSKRPDLLGNAPVVKAAVVDEQKVVEVAAPVAEVAAVPAVSYETVRASILALAVEKTGYPEDMLDLDLDLEADLGVDTVKQAEMMAAIREMYSIPRDENVKLRDFPTLAKVIQFACDKLAAGVVSAAPVAAAPVAATPAPAKAERVRRPRTEAASFDAADLIPRRVPVPTLRPALNLCKTTGVKLGAGSRVVIMPDKGGVAEILSQKLQAIGVEVLRIENVANADALAALLNSWTAAGPLQGIFWLPALDREAAIVDMDMAAWHEAVWLRVKSLFTTMKTVYEQIAVAGTFLTSATRLGGQHGYDPAGAVAPMGGAVTGFTKTYKRERPDVAVKAVDFEADRKAAEIADILIEETLRDPGAVEIGYKLGARWTVTLQEQPVADGQPGMILDEDSVFVITGAAGSIVSAITSDLATASGGVFYLLDMVPEPDANNPDLERFVTDKEGLKRDLFARITARGERATPALVERELAGLERARAAQNAINAVHEAGGIAHYFSVNLTDTARVAEIIQQVYARSGRIDVLLHAAGLERSHMLPDKPQQEFDLVFDVKCDGWFNLLRAIGDQPLGATVTFCSIAGRFGNAGQTDYSSANDLMCKYSSSFRTTKPGTRGIAIDWTAWGGIGMATRGSIPKMMEVAGIDMLPPEAGVPWIRRELTMGGTRGENLVAQRLGVMLKEWDDNGGLDTAVASSGVFGPMIGKIVSVTIQNGLTIETTLDPKAQPFLYDHQIDGTPVLPGVMGIEAFAEAAQCLLPGWNIEAVEDVNFLAPFKFYRSEPRMVTVEAFLQSQGEEVVATCKLTGSRKLPNSPEPQVTTHFTATVRLSKLAPRTAVSPAVRAPEGAVMEAADIYGIYFHGPAYQVMGSAWREGNRIVGKMADRLPENHSPAELPVLMAPRLIEFCFQTAGLWEMSEQGTMGLPLHVERAGLWLPSNLAVGELYAVVTPGQDGESFEAEVVDSAGNRMVTLAGYRTVALPTKVDSELLKALYGEVLA
jgi:acyl transferase domain-containing protein/acyl carrier protein